MSKDKETHQVQSANPEVVNWLECLDAQARTLAPLQDWRDFDYFMLVRYPHLQPISPPGPDVTVLPPQIARRFFESSKRVFYEMLADYEEEIAAHDKGKRALEKLTKEQRQQVAALLIDSLVSLETCKPDAKLAKELRQLADEAPRRLRMLKSRIEKARKALEELRDYSRRLHWTMRGDSRERHWERRDSRWVAEHCLKTLEAVELPKPESFRQRRERVISDSPYPHDPTALNMVKFYWLFRYGCDQSGHESEVRVALIRNAFWAEWAKPVTFRHRYYDAESQGCDAVRKAVSRFQLDQGTTP